MNNPFLLKVFVIWEEEPGTMTIGREIFIPITNIAYLEKTTEWGHLGIKGDNYLVILKDPDSIKVDLENHEHFFRLITEDQD